MSRTGPVHTKCGKISGVLNNSQSSTLGTDRYFSAAVNAQLTVLTPGSWGQLAHVNPGSGGSALRKF